MWGYPYKTAIKGHNEAYILFIGVSRWLLPFPSGEGKGEGPLTYRGISVITPLPFGEGKGEGPQQRKIITYTQAKHPLNKGMATSQTERITHKKSMCYEQQ